MNEFKKYSFTIAEVNYLSDKKADIFKAGRELFYTKGFKDTNVSDIAKAAGIGVGTFYNYYSSKEELFTEVYFRENEDYKMHLVQSMDMNEDPVSMVTKIVSKNIEEMNANMILKEWYNTELFSKLEKDFYDKGEMNAMDKFMVDGRTQMIKDWMEDGRIRKDISVDMIGAIFNAILYIEIHKRDIGIQYFPQLIQLITEFVMKGLTDCPE